MSSDERVRRGNSQRHSHAEKLEVLACLRAAQSCDDPKCSEVFPLMSSPTRLRLGAVERIPAISASSALAAGFNRGTALIPAKL